MVSQVETPCSMKPYMYLFCITSWYLCTLSGMFDNSVSSLVLCSFGSQLSSNPMHCITVDNENLLYKSEHREVCLRC